MCNSRGNVVQHNKSLHTPNNMLLNTLDITLHTQAAEALGCTLRFNLCFLMCNIVFCAKEPLRLNLFLCQY